MTDPAPPLAPDSSRLGPEAEGADPVADPARLEPAADAADAAADAAGADADRLAHETPTTCLNCGAVLPGRFCPDCGQRDQPIRQPAHVFIAESVSEYFGLDGRLWRSLGALLFKPGALTEAYLDGRRTRYLRPLRLYLTATVAFFFLLSLKDPLAAGRMSVELSATPADTTLRAQTLANRLDDRADVFEAERDAVLSAAALLPGLPRGDSLRALAGDLAASDSLLDEWRDRLEEVDDDSLVAVASLPGSVVVALQDTGRVEVVRMGTQMTGLGDKVPEWAKGDLARQMEESESPAEQNLLMAQYQRSILRQVPTALFLVLPLFALLLKGAYLTGAGRPARHPQRPPVPPAGAPAWRRAVHVVADLRWRWGRWRARRRTRVRRRRLVKAQRRTVRGAPRRALSWARAHPALRPWRVRRIRLLRQSLRRSRSSYYSEHLVFALHVHAFTFLVLTVLVGTGLNGTNVGVFETTAGTALGASAPVYYLLAQKRVYQETWPRTLVKAVVVGSAYLVLVTGGALVAAGLALRLS